MLVLRFIGQGWGRDGGGQRLHGRVEALVLRGHVYVLRVVLLGGDAPSVDVVVPLLLLLALWSLLLQLLTLVLGPPVLEPHLHLQTQGGVQILVTLVANNINFVFC